MIICLACDSERGMFSYLDPMHLLTFHLFSLEKGELHVVENEPVESGFHRPH